MKRSLTGREIVLMFTACLEPIAHASDRLDDVAAHAVADYLPQYRCMHRVTVVNDRRSPGQ